MVPRAAARRAEPGGRLGTRWAALQQLAWPGPHGRGAQHLGKRARVADRGGSGEESQAARLGPRAQARHHHRHRLAGPSPDSCLQSLNGGRVSGCSLGEPGRGAAPLRGGPFPRQCWARLLSVGHSSGVPPSLPQPRGRHHTAHPPAVHRLHQPEPASSLWLHTRWPPALSLAPLGRQGNGHEGSLMWPPRLHRHQAPGRLWRPRLGTPPPRTEPLQSGQEGGRGSGRGRGVGAGAAQPARAPRPILDPLRARPRGRGQTDKHTRQHTRARERRRRY